MHPLHSALPILLFTSTFATADPGEKEFVEWARARAIPIAPDGKAFESLAPDLKEVRLIGVGESVHEAEPFLTFRSDLLKYLVQHQRVTALILESGLPEVMAADDYVRGRTATLDYTAALPSHGHLEGTRRIVDWLREWNQGPGRDRPVGIYGADLPAQSGSMVPALDRLLELAPGNGEIKAAVEAIRPTAVQVTGRYWKGAADKYKPLPPEAKAALTANVTRLVEAVEPGTVAHRMAFVVQKFEEMLRLGAFHPSMARNHAMAGNVLWVLDRLPAGERAVYWAHNAHIQRVNVKGEVIPPPGNFTSTGSLLHAALGGRYYAIGTTYGGPSLDKGTPPEEGSLDEVMGKVGVGPLLVSLRGAWETKAEVAEWLVQERPIRFQAGSLKLMVAHAFGTVAYFEGATRAGSAP